MKKTENQIVIEKISTVLQQIDFVKDECSDIINSKHRPQRFIIIPIISIGLGTIQVLNPDKTKIIDDIFTYFGITVIDVLIGVILSISGIVAIMLFILPYIIPHVFVEWRSHWNIKKMIGNLAQCQIILAELKYHFLECSKKSENIENNSSDCLEKTFKTVASITLNPAQKNSYKIKNELRSIEFFKKFNIDECLDEMKIDEMTLPFNLKWYIQTEIEKYVSSKTIRGRILNILKN